MAQTPPDVSDTTDRADGADNARESEIEKLKEENAKLTEENKQLKESTQDSNVLTLKDIVKKGTFGVRNLCANFSLLYLTNAQAAQLDIDAMPALRSAMGIREPKQVIRIFPCRDGEVFWKGWKSLKHIRPTKCSPELEADREKVENQLHLLALEVLHLACRCPTLIIGTSQCCLTDAFAKVSQPAQHRLGASCPFQFLVFVDVKAVHKKSEDESSHAYELQKHEKRWQDLKKLGEMKNAMNKQFGQDEAYWPAHDTTPGANQYVVFESLDRDTEEFRPYLQKKFENDFISSFASNLPVIALQTFGDDRYSTVAQLADHVDRKLPLLLIDSRVSRDQWKSSYDTTLFQNNNTPIAKSEQHQKATENGICDRLPFKTGCDRFPFKTGEEHTGLLLDLWNGLRGQAEKLHDKKLIDFHTISALAFAKLKLQQGLCHYQEEHSGQQHERFSLRALNNLKIFEAIQCLEEFSFGKSKDSLDSTFEADAANLLAADAANLLLLHIGLEMEVQCNVFVRKARDGIKAIGETKDWKSFRERLDEEFASLRACAFHKETKLREWGESIAEFVETGHPHNQLKVKVHQHTEEGLFAKKKEEFLKLVEEDIETTISLTTDRSALLKNQTLWVGIHTVLSATNVQAARIEDIKNIRNSLKELAQRDRLPEQNSLEALYVLRDAWTFVDLLSVHAKQYKMYSQLSYIVLSLLSLLVTWMIIIYDQCPNLFSKEAFEWSIIVVTVCGSVLAGFITFTEPGKKWMQLRGGELMLQSEIWKFRTKVAEYRISYYGGSTTLAESQATDNLRSRYDSIREQVVKGAGLTQTAFYSHSARMDDPLNPDVRGLNIAKHFQFKPTETSYRSSLRLTEGFCQWRKTSTSSVVPESIGNPAKPQNDKSTERIDSFHEPAKPKDYIKWRLLEARSFYANRIPRYRRWRYFIQGFGLLASSSGVVFVILGIPSWVGLVTSCATALASWQEFMNINKKLYRQSTVVDSLTRLWTWWKSLPELDQWNVARIHELVETSESIICNEHLAWLSDVQRVSRLEAATQKHQRQE
jgi:hypothetical protein